MGTRTTGLAVTGVGTGAVSVVCAIASYRHIAHLATSVGQGQLAMWLPLGIDGLMISSTASILTDRHAGRKAGLSARLGLALGLTASLAANLVAVDPTLVSERAVRLVLAGYPPAALAIAGHVLMTMLFGASAHATPTGNARSGTATVPKQKVPKVAGRQGKTPSPTDPVDAQELGRDRDVLEVARRLSRDAVSQSGRRPGHVRLGRLLAAELGRDVPEREAKALASQVKAEADEPAGRPLEVVR